MAGSLRDSNSASRQPVDSRFSSPEHIVVSPARPTTASPKFSTTSTAVRIHSLGLLEAHQSSQPAVSPPPPQCAQLEHFDIGARVFVVNSSKDSNIFPRRITLGNGRGFGNFPHVSVSPQQSVQYDGMPFEVGQNAYHYDAPGVYIVLGRWVRLRREAGRFISVPAGAGLRLDMIEDEEMGVIYHVTPEKGIGTEALAFGSRLAKVRFRSGDWAWYLPSEDSDEVVEANTTVQKKERALIVTAGVACGKRSYHIHLVASRRDRLFVTDAQLEEVVEPEIGDDEIRLTDEQLDELLRAET